MSKIIANLFLHFRGVLNNVGNQRHVELGSSHPLYSIPNLQPQIEAQITKVFQKRSTVCIVE